MKLEIDGVHAGYENTSIIRDINCTVEDGEIVGIMGKNGVGKTTLLKTIMGLLEPSRGAIRADGTELVAGGEDRSLGSYVGESRPAGALPEGVRQLPSRAAAGIPDTVKRVSQRVPDGVTSLPSRLVPSATVAANERAGLGIGYVPQGRDVFPGLTVEQNLLMGEGIGADEETLYETVYELFPILEERADQDAETMSGGQQQMLAIGRALVGAPDLLLVDEPSEGVQPSIIQSITEDLGRINEELGTTILFVEQNLSVVQNLADRCYAMDRGTIVDEIDGSDLQNRKLLADHLAV